MARQNGANSNSSTGILKFVILGGIVALSVFGFLFAAVHEIHHDVQEHPSQSASGGAPVPASPVAKPQSRVLAEAALQRKVASDRLAGQAWEGLRDHVLKGRHSGPFHNLPGAVGEVQFVYPDMLPEVDLKTYPPTNALLDIIQRWNPDDTDNIPNPFQETLQVFNYSNPEERLMAEAYRNAEVPFKVFGIPEMEMVVDKWTDTYLSRKMEGPNINYKVEQSADNHFMYWVNRGYKGKLGEFEPPTKHVKTVDYKGFAKMAHDADAVGINHTESHYYLMTGVDAGRLVANKKAKLGQFLSNDLALFSTTVDNFFVSKVSANKGIQCRFGMKGVIAEAHYDGGRNMVAMLKGAKRYILAPPSECKALGVIKEKAHPSYRHSILDWSDELEAVREGFAKVRAVDTILHEGEVLYIPSYWFHYMCSLDHSIQCNTRSGPPPEGNNEHFIRECMAGGSGEGEVAKAKGWSDGLRKKNKARGLRTGA